MSTTKSKTKPKKATAAAPTMSPADEASARETEAAKKAEADRQRLAEERGQREARDEAHSTVSRIIREYLETPALTWSPVFQNGTTRDGAKFVEDLRAALTTYSKMIDAERQNAWAFISPAEHQAFTERMKPGAHFRELTATQIEEVGRTARRIIDRTISGELTEDDLQALRQPDDGALWLLLAIVNALTEGLETYSPTEAPAQNDAHQTPAPFIPSQQQKRILAKLDGKAMRLKDLAAGIGDQSQMSRDHLKELMELGKVKHHKRIGYYRPDAPPPECADVLKE